MFCLVHPHILCSYFFNFFSMDAFFYLWQEGIDVVLRLKLIHLLLWFLSFPAIVVILVFLFLFCLAKPNICRLAYFVIVLSRFVVVPAVVWISIVLQLLEFLPFFLLLSMYYGHFYELFHVPRRQRVGFSYSELCFYS